jgi:hypothetical protein
MPESINMFPYLFVLRRLRIIPHMGTRNWILEKRLYDEADTKLNT